MIYLQDTTDAQHVLVPMRTIVRPVEGYELTLRAAKTGVDITLDASNIVGTSLDAVVVAVWLPEGVHGGEYGYTLTETASDVVVSEGIALVGVTATEADEYPETINKYNEYNGD